MLNFTLNIFLSSAERILSNLRLRLCASQIKQIGIYLSIFFFPFIGNITSTAHPNDQLIRTAAIFVENRAGNAFNDKIPVFEDFITGRITEKGFRVLSREVVVNSLKNYRPEETKTSNQKASNEGLDKLLSDNTTILRLGQMIGADYILVASITSLGTEKKVFEGYGIETTNFITHLRASYKVLDIAYGGTLVADTIKVSKTLRSTNSSHNEDSDMINELLDDASVKIAESLGKKQIAPPTPVPELVEITIACGMQDLAQLPVNIPDVRITPDNKVIIEKDALNVHVLDVTVELNGVVLGSAPGTFKVHPGLNKIRLSRDGFKDWERTIYAIQGQKLKVALQMSDSGYARWKDNTAFIQGLKNNEKLTDATVELIKGRAQMLRQSGFKVDVKEDVKVDAKKLKSIYNLFR